MTSPLLDAKDTKRVQEVLGTLLYYARAIDCTLIPSIGSIATEQSCATKMTMEGITKLLNHVSTYPDASIRFHASGMQLYIESDASYLSETKARSRFAGYHYLSDKLEDPTKPPANQPPLNGPINVPCKILKEVLSSASEAEMAGLFHNGKEAVPERIPSRPPQLSPTIALPPALPTTPSSKSDPKPLICASTGFVTAFAKANLSSSYWRRGITNRSDYFTKHHSDKHHRVTRPIYINDKTKPRSSNYYALLSEAPPNPNGKPSPISGEGVLIPISPCAHQPFYALRYPQCSNVGPTRWASYSANRRQ